MSFQAFIGIDFGTTNSCAAWFNPKTGQAEILRNAEDEDKTPSVVYFGDEETLVGKHAEERLEHPEDRKRVISADKRDLAKPRVRMVGSRPVTPVDVAAEILKKLKRDAEETLHRTVNRAVITYPAVFDEVEKDRLREAGAKAGFKEVELLEEPVAAALAYSHEGTQVGQNVFVYDLGGGTFDLAMLVQQDGSDTFRLALAPRGIRIGGEDFDRAIYDYFDQGFQEIAGEPICKEGVDLHLLRQCRRYKENLSVSEKPQPLSWMREKKRLKLTINRERFEGLIQHHVDRTIQLTKNLRDDAVKAHLAPETVVLIGGSSRIPVIQQELREALGMEPRKWQKQDVAVALGAAYHAQTLWQELNKACPANTNRAASGNDLPEKGQLLQQPIISDDIALMPATSGVLGGVINCPYCRRMQELHMPAGEWSVTCNSCKNRWSQIWPNTERHIPKCSAMSDTSPRGSYLTSPALLDHRSKWRYVYGRDLELVELFIVEAFAKLVPKDDVVHRFPDIPEMKMANAKARYASFPSGLVIALIDNTLLRSAREGCLITTFGLYWKNIFEDAANQPYFAMNPARVDFNWSIFKRGLTLGPASEVAGTLTKPETSLAWAEFIRLASALTLVLQGDSKPLELASVQSILTLALAKNIFEPCLAGALLDLIANRNQPALPNSSDAGGTKEQTQTQEQLAVERLAQERLMQERLTQKRLEEELLAQERLTQEQHAQKRLEEERLAQARLRQEQIEEVLEAERLAQISRRLLEFLKCNGTVEAENIEEERIFEDLAAAGLARQEGDCYVYIGPMTPDDWVKRRFADSNAESISQDFWTPLLLVFGLLLFICIIVVASTR